MVYHVVSAHVHNYIMVIPCHQGLYGIYCLSPRVKTINPIPPERVWYDCFKAYYGNASAALMSCGYNHGNILAP